MDFCTNIFKIGANDKICFKKSYRNGLCFICFHKKGFCSKTLSNGKNCNRISQCEKLCSICYFHLKDDYEELGMLREICKDINVYELINAASLFVTINGAGEETFKDIVLIGKYLSSIEIESKLGEYRNLIRKEIYVKDFYIEIFHGTSNIDLKNIKDWRELSTFVITKDNNVSSMDALLLIIWKLIISKPPEEYYNWKERIEKIYF